MAIKKNFLQKPIFVIGVPRSGTTIISEALSTCPNLGWFSNYYNLFPSFPEISIFNRILNIPKIGWYLRGKKKQEQGILSSVRRILPYSVEAYKIWEKHLGAKFLYDYLLNKKAEPNEINSILNDIRKSLIYQRKERFIAKITGPAKICYLTSIFNDAIFVHVLRDPRAVVSSLLKVNFWLNNNGLSSPWWKNYKDEYLLKEWASYNKHPVALASIQWKNIVESTWSEKKIIDNSKYIEVKYEDFVLNPKQVIRNLLRRIDLSPTKEINQYLNTIGRPIRDGKKFEKHLKVSEIEMIHTITYEIAKRAGYTW